ncbi:transcriptional regulator [Paraburkholderia denitrificans]|uniref:Transcriptional regulator n=1 Tax=Paraburkholderia denitrificans TaxID=694025 RepID=A0ABW0JCQ7_9BURK
MDQTAPCGFPHDFSAVLQVSDRKLYGLFKQPHSSQKSLLLSHTPPMQTADEKQAFSARLRQALKRSPKKIATATELAVQFSLRHPEAAITAQAAQKWLTGKACPTPDKIETLAKWLDVSPMWLRYGLADKARPARSRDAAVKHSAKLQPAADEILLLERLRALPEARRLLVLELVEQFALDTAVWTQRS